MPEELAIRTMKDDMADMRTDAAVPHVLEQEQSASLPAGQAGEVRSPKKKMPEQKALVRPEKQKKNVILGVAYILLFCLLFGGGSYYAYTWWNKHQQQAPSQEAIAALYEVIPKDALAVIDYHIGSSQNKEAIESLWGERGESAGLGNPIPFLTIPDISHIYYVLMQDNPRPFVLLKKTQGTMQYIATQSGVQIIEKNGWYILHSIDTSQYANALQLGTLTGASALVPSEGTSDYIARYGLSPVFVSHEFNTIASSTIGLSRLGGLVFTVTSVPQDGTLRVAAYIPGQSSTETLSPQTQELISLIPGDVTFSYVGTTFMDEMMKWQDEGAKLDKAVIAQPSVRQFLAQLTAPYAIFERQGADGIRDIGLVIALPEELKKQIHTGDPIIEQSLPALVPLIMGKSLGIQLAFTDGEYGNVPLRYVNISGQTQALDYMVGDSFLLVSSSREGMAALIDTALGTKSGLLQGEQWQGITDKAAAVIENRKFVIGSIKDPILLSVLPGALASSKIPLVVSSHQISTGTDIQAVLSLE